MKKHPIKIPTLALYATYTITIIIYTYSVLAMFINGYLTFFETCILAVLSILSYSLYTMNKDYNDFKKEQLTNIVEMMEMDEKDGLYKDAEN